MSNVIFKAYDLPSFDSIVETELMAKKADGQLGYVQASQLQTTLDGNGLATDADVTALSASLAAAVAVGVGGSTFDIAYATNNGNGTNYKVGDDAWIGDVNSQNTFQVKGVQDATKGYIKFGSGSATPVVGNSGDGQFSITGGLKLQSGSNKPMGIVTLNGGNPGTATITNSLITSTSIIMLTKQTFTDTNARGVAVVSKTNGSCSISSGHNGDADVVAYLIINPA